MNLRSMNKYVLGLIVGVALTAGANQVSEIIFQSQGEASLKVEKTTPEGDDLPRLSYSTVSTRYIFLSTWSLGFNGDNSMFVIETKEEGAFSPSFEGSDAATTFIARHPDNLNQVIWTRKFDGYDDAEVLDLGSPYLKLASYGCCGANTNYILVNPVTGENFLRYTDYDYTSKGLFALAVPNTQIPERLISLVEPEESENLNGRALLATVQYATKNGMQQTVKVFSKVKENWGAGISSVKITNIKSDSKNEIRDSLVNLWDIDGNKDPKAIGGVQLSFEVNAGNGDEKVVIPVIGDRLAVEKAVYNNKQITLQ